MTGSNNVSDTDESFHLLETGSTVKSRRDNDADDDGSNFRYEVSFDNIVSEEEEYTVTISTELNGRTVTQMVEKFPVGSPQEEEPLPEEAKMTEASATITAEDEVKAAELKEQ